MPTTDEVDYPFSVHHERYNSVHEKLDMMRRMTYAPIPLQGIPVRENITEVLGFNILEYIDTRMLLSWSCTCRLSHDTTKPHLPVVFQQLQLDCKILSKILHDRYLREALHLVQTHRENYAHLGDGAISVDLHDLDIVLMRAGGKDENDESENLSEAEEERLTFIEAIEFETKKVCSEIISALGYETDIAPLGETEEDTPMRVHGRMSSHYTYEQPTYEQPTLQSPSNESSDSDDSEDESLGAIYMVLENPDMPPLSFFEYP